MRESAARREYRPIAMHHLGGKTDVGLSNNRAWNSVGGIDSSQYVTLSLFCSKLRKHK
jgi:hypothetical protein